jgi:hypothetical protein
MVRKALACAEGVEGAEGFFTLGIPECRLFETWEKFSAVFLRRKYSGYGCLRARVILLSEQPE